MPERILLAIDAGGTRTRCVVVTSRGRLLGSGAGGPGNHILDGWEIARASLAAATADALAGAGQPHVDAVVVGSAGVGPNGEGKEVVESLLAEILPGVERRRAIGDMVVALWGALRTPVGVVVSAGTGSVCFGRNAAGATRQVGGWGHLMGDEGSAYDIALRALRAVARAEDGRGARTELRRALLRRAQVRTPQELALHLYAQTLGRERLAAFAVDVADVARQGDATAVGILRQAGEELALAAVTALDTLDLREGVVSYAGSVFAAGAPVLEPFSAHIVRVSPRTRVEPPFLPPVGGALRLALRDAEAEENDELLESWREQLVDVSA